MLYGRGLQEGRVSGHCVPSKVSCQGLAVLTESYESVKQGIAAGPVVLVLLVRDGLVAETDKVLLVLGGGIVDDDKIGTSRRGGQKL